MRHLLLLGALAACGSKSAAKDPVGSGTGNGPGTGSGSAPPAATCDVSTEEKAAAYYTKLTGQPIDRDHGGCIQLSSTFPGWVKFGSFAYDLGCEYDKAIYRCALTGAASAKQAMADAGYGAADQARRQTLLVAFLSEIRGARLVSDDSQGEFGKYGKTFTAPAFDGAAVTAWISDAGGMSPEVTYTQVKWPVDADGLLGAASDLDQFTTTYP